MKKRKTLDGMDLQKKNKQNKINIMKKGKQQKNGENNTNEKILGSPIFIKS